MGSSVVAALGKHATLLEQRTGRRLEIVAAATRNPTKHRDVDISHLHFVDHPLKLVESNDIDVVVELIGGADGIAKELVESSLAAKKHVVTANKALIAHHGLELAELAEDQGVSLMFEAAIAGGIPVVKTLKEGTASNQYHSVHGILNGTSNYILTEMQRSRRDFDAVLKEAQDKGYAEADPTFDVDGMDAAHKLAIIASLAFGIAPHMSHVHTQGIRHISLADLDYASELGYAIKLLASAVQTDAGVLQTVCPCLVANDQPLARVDGVTNAVSIEGDLIGSLFLEGPGAGGDATASAVIADLIDVARHKKTPTFGIAAPLLAQPKLTKQTTKSSYYMRLETNDQPGSLADITRICHGQNISVDIMKQPRHTPGVHAPVIITTHPTTIHAVETAAAAMGALPSVVTEPQLIRMM